MKPKYEIGQKVWTMQRDSAKKIEIKGIFLADSLFQRGYYYTSNKDTDFLSVDWIEQKYLFPSKEELIKSL